MNEIKKCEDCGLVLTHIERTGPRGGFPLGGMGEIRSIMRRDEVSRCPQCGGRVTWIHDGPPPPFGSSFKDVEEHFRKVRRARNYFLLCVLGWVIYYFIVSAL